MVVVAGTLALGIVQPGLAAMQITVGSVSANPGSVGNAVDVTLTNDSGSAISIAGFAFQITAGSTDIRFTDVNYDTTDPYVFAGNSLLGPDIILSGSGSATVSASDLYTGTGGATVFAGATVGLGHVLFDVVDNPNSPITVTISDYPDTSLTGSDGGNIPFTTKGGTINIGGNVNIVPEPSSMLLFSGSAVMLGLSYAWRRRRRPTCDA